MKTLKAILSILAATLGTFGMAGLFNLLLVGRLITISPDILRETMIYPLIIAGYLALSCLLYFVGTRSQFARARLPHWIVTGIIIWEAAFGLSALVLQGTYNLPLAAIPLDLFWYVVEGGVGGLVMFWFHRTDAGTLIR